MARRSKGVKPLEDQGWEAEKNAIRAVRAPDVRRGLWLRYLGRAAVWASIVMNVLLAAFVLNGIVAPKPAAVSQAAGGTLSSSQTLAKATATSTMQQWLKQVPAQLPGGQILTVDGVDERSYQPTAKSNKSVDPEQAVLDVVRFTLIDPNGSLYKSAVSVAVNRAGFATVVSSPSLEPLASGSDPANQGDFWPGRASVPVTDSVTSAVQQWAQVYTGGDSNALKLSVGDTDASHMYLPLPKMSNVTAASTKATAVVPADPKHPGAQVLAVRVDLSMVWQGQASAAPGTSAQPPTTSMDVLVTRADTAAPLVTAWGAPGTGPSLTSFCNAIDGTNRTAVDPATQKPITASPSAVAKPSGSASPKPSVSASAAPSSAAASPSASASAPASPSESPSK